jgi:hypothetical protein
MRQDRKDRFAHSTLEAPNREATHPDADVMGVARQTKAAHACGFMLQWEAKGEEKGEDAFDKRLGVVQELKVRRFILEVDGDSAVLPYPCGCVAHMAPLDCKVSVAYEVP